MKTETDINFSQRPMTWISVEDRLPSGVWNIHHTDLSEDVLVANSAGVVIGRYNRTDGCWDVGLPNDAERIDKITHWMPLPSNPG